MGSTLLNSLILLKTTYHTFSSAPTFPVDTASPGLRASVPDYVSFFPPSQSGGTPET